ncbi:hypothetical protein ACQE3E_02675 [Methylomonas sp. MED-D]|nr:MULTISPECIES: hypothetical protein [Methylomonas]MDT4330190.1 hypothetical protein [Methylomonas sp. MV1]WGS86672.1 hypothetical protein QC632_02675 [Methylomonas sp. UP202]
MIKRKSDPFLAQTSTMLLILLVVYLTGANAALPGVDFPLSMR